MKRILIISPMPPLLGGVSVSSYRLFENLKADGYDVNTYNIRPKGKFNNTSLGIILRFLWIPFYVIFHKKYDIIHCHVPGIYRKLYISIAKLIFFKGAKLIFTLHGDVRPLLNKVAIFSMSKADRLICVQKGDSNLLPNHLRKNSFDIPAFIMPKKISEKSIPVEVLNFAKNKKHPLILFYGGVVVNEHYNDLYGINDAIDIYLALKEKHINAQMIMLISFKVNTCKEFVNKAKGRLRNDDNVLFVENGGFDMLPLFKYADLYIRPTKTDGDSLAVREALCLHCPVIASNKSVRPKGVVVYSSANEFLELSKKYITEVIQVPEQENFYNQIIDVYETC